MSHSPHFFKSTVRATTLTRAKELSEQAYKGCLPNGDPSKISVSSVDLLTTTDTTLVSPCPSDDPPLFLTRPIVWVNNKADYMNMSNNLPKSLVAAAKDLFPILACAELAKVEFSDHKSH